MRFLLLALPLLSFGCTKKQQTPSLVEFQFNGRIFTQTVNKDGNIKSGNKINYNAAVIYSLESNVDGDWHLTITKRDSTYRDITVTMNGNVSDPNSETWSTTLGDIDITESNGKASGTFEGRLYNGSVYTRLTNGKFEDIPVVNL